MRGGRECGEEAQSSAALEFFDGHGERSEGASPGTGVRNEESDQLHPSAFAGEDDLVELRGNGDAAWADSLRALGEDCSGDHDCRVRQGGAFAHIVFEAAPCGAVHDCVLRYGIREQEGIAQRLFIASDVACRDEMAASESGIPVIRAGGAWHRQGTITAEAGLAGSEIGGT